MIFKQDKNKITSFSLPKKDLEKLDEHVKRLNIKKSHLFQVLVQAINKDLDKVDNAEELDFLFKNLKNIL